MHAYLITGTDSEKVKAKSEELAKKLKARIFEFPLAKIEDVRQLNSFTRLTLSAPTAILLYSIGDATGEAASAFFKNLEEPQENLFYILTTTSIHKVLPTIVSRCQVIKVQSTKYKVQSEEINTFLEMSIGERLAYLDKIKDRKEAADFLENLILVYHQKLHQTTDSYAEIAQNIDRIGKTLNNIKANGNVSLQLANVAVQIS